MSDRKTPYTLGNEKQTLKDFINYLRESIIFVADTVATPRGKVGELNRA